MFVYPVLRIVSAFMNWIYLDMRQSFISVALSFGASVAVITEIPSLLVDIP